MPKRISDPKKRVKREDVAVEAGVSTATVSYVLNRTKRLSPEVEQRVLETAARLNYIPNRIAQSLARNKTNALALITADITNVYQLAVIMGLQAEALKNDYIVYIFDAAGDVVFNFCDIKTSPTNFFCPPCLPYNSPVQPIDCKINAPN